ncbi:MAG: zincin-like metallopeptidase domain-containing protein [Bacteroidota bacterium]
MSHSRLYKSILNHIIELIKNKAIPHDVIQYIDFNYDEPYRGMETDETRFNDCVLNEEAEKVIASTGATITHEYGERAGYLRRTDEIILPLTMQFNGRSDLYYTYVFSALAHWTGAPNRLNREQGDRGYQDYELGAQDHQREAIIADLSAAFSLTTLGFSKAICANIAVHIEQNLHNLGQDHQFLETLLPPAQAATAYIFSFSS